MNKTKLLKNKISRHTIALIVLSFASVAAFTQEIPKNEAEYDSLYAKRILQEEIDGTYIPRDLNDAFAELKRLSSAADLQKLKAAPEDVARYRLHFGLGRWMIVNWGFYEGSRLSHYLKSAGLEQPDDMARVILVCFHRHLNQKDLKFEEEVVFYRGLREKERLEKESQKQVISEEKHIKKD